MLPWRRPSGNHTRMRVMEERGLQLRLAELKWEMHVKELRAALDEPERAGEERDVNVKEERTELEKTEKVPKQNQKGKTRWGC